MRLSPSRYEDEVSPERTDNAIKKLLMREASFLDEEKRILDEQRRRMRVQEKEPLRGKSRGRQEEKKGGA